MLLVRGAQMQELARPSLDAFVEQIAEQVEEHWWYDYQELGHDGSRAAIRRSIAKAEGYGITSRRDLHRYVNFTFLLGQDFDESAEHAWVAPILRDPQLAAADKLNLIAKHTLR